MIGEEYLGFSTALLFPAGRNSWPVLILDFPYFVVALLKTKIRSRKQQGFIERFCFLVLQRETVTSWERGEKPCFLGGLSGRCPRFWRKDAGGTSRMLQMLNIANKYWSYNSIEWYFSWESTCDCFTMPNAGKYQSLRQSSNELYHSFIFTLPLFSGSDAGKRWRWDYDLGIFIPLSCSDFDKTKDIILSQTPSVSHSNGSSISIKTSNWLYLLQQVNNRSSPRN